MLETIAIILIVLWLLGMVSGYTLGNFIYVLLVIAIVLFLVRLLAADGWSDGKVAIRRSQIADSIAD